MGQERNCSRLNSEEWPSSRDFLVNLTVAEKAMVVMCSVFCVINIIIFIDNTYFVWTRSINSKRTAMGTVWMVGLTPMLSVIALLGMMLPRIHIFQDMLAVICIAVVMYKFVQLIRAYARYHEKILEKVRTLRLRFNLGPCCCCCLCLPTAAINRENTEKIKWLILQYPIISIATSVLTMVTWLNGNYQQGEWLADNPYPYLITVRVVSVLVALHGLNVVVTPCLDAMKSLLIRPKFLALRLSMLFYAIQGIIFNSLVEYTDLFEMRDCFSGDVMGNFYQNLVFCVEMFLLTLLNFWSYRRALAPADDDTDLEGTGSDGVGDFDGRDILEDHKHEEQLKQEKIFNRDQRIESDGYKEKKSQNDETDIGEIQFPKDKDANQSGYINQVNIVEGEGGEAVTPSQDFNLKL